ncbi:hypothetical protein [Plastoroseomonas hellenica]|uniref:hypothetical protein n=1 Tax=Plastoroseomonas hellenica TaxID=2687306 RepID=UPI001BA6668E|nr:hypothetical protein [Plastoroseomonas hellenica]MBR0645286.1 hypothetical protein [Plastoroseomonas hellenica]
MLGWLRRLGLALMLVAGAVPALAQGWGTKPEPLPPQGGSYAPAQPAPMAPAPSAGPQQGQRPQRCAPQLANGCLGMQSSCQVACPGTWSSNPAAPAFTPTDRAGCMQRCLTQYQRCMTQYGCW